MRKPINRVYFYLSAVFAAAALSYLFNLQCHDVVINSLLVAAAMLNAEAGYRLGKIHSLQDGFHVASNEYLTILHRLARDGELSQHDQLIKIQEIMYGYLRPKK